MLLLHSRVYSILCLAWIGTGACAATVIALIALVAVLVRRLIQQTEQGDVAGRKKTMRLIVAAMVLPLLVAIASFVGIFVWLSAGI